MGPIILFQLNFHWLVHVAQGNEELLQWRPSPINLCMAHMHATSLAITKTAQTRP
jgi:hypothetical protein